MGLNQCNSAWTDELRERVKTLWEKHSATEISGMLAAEGYNFSRNAVMGLLHRAGLSLSPEKTEARQKRNAEYKARARPQKRNPHNIPRLRIIRANGNSNHLKVITSFETAQERLRCVEIECLTTFADVTGCRYSNSDDAPFLFCNGTQKAGSSYCVGHHHLCWTPAADPKQKYTPKAFERVSA